MCNVQCAISIFSNIIDMSNCERLHVGFGTYFPTLQPPPFLFQQVQDTV